AGRVQGHVEDRERQTGKGLAGRAAFRGEVEELAARRAATGQDGAVGQHGNRHRPDVGVARGDAGGERLGGERPQQALVFGLGGCRQGRGDALFRLAEERIYGRRAARRRGRPEVARRLTHRRRRADVCRGAVVGGQHARRRRLLVAGVIGGQGEEFVGV